MAWIIPIITIVSWLPIIHIIKTQYFNVTPPNSIGDLEWRPKFHYDIWVYAINSSKLSSFGIQIIPSQNPTFQYEIPLITPKKQAFMLGFDWNPNKSAIFLGNHPAKISGKCWVSEVFGFTSATMWSWTGAQCSDLQHRCPGLPNTMEVTSGLYHPNYCCYFLLRSRGFSFYPHPIPVKRHAHEHTGRCLAGLALCEKQPRPWSWLRSMLMLGGIHRIVLVVHLMNELLDAGIIGAMFPLSNLGDHHNLLLSFKSP